MIEYFKTQMDAKTLLAEVRGIGLTQIEVANGMGVSQGTVSKIERGQTQDLKISTYHKLVALHNREVLSKKGGQPSIVSNKPIQEMPHG